MLDISSYSTSESSNNSSKRRTESAILMFPCFTVGIFARNFERDGLGRVGSTNREITVSFVTQYPKFQTRILGRMERALDVIRTFIAPGLFFDNTGQKKTKQDPAEHRNSRFELDNIYIRLCMGYLYTTQVLYTSYAMVSSGILWNIPRGTWFFSVHTSL